MDVDEHGSGLSVAPQEGNGRLPYDRVTACVIMIEHAGPGRTTGVVLRPTWSAAKKEKSKR